ncbi:purine-cytosine permease family protein [Streptomyces sp. NPDC001663]|uniref:purine-cytosine permease family protein n=1 Tax=Streptomyces sp. NPDC001663 TaxID=3364597 RepID=UPI0036877974
MSEVPSGQSTRCPEQGEAEKGAVRNVDRAGTVETRGVDFVPDDERHGRPTEMFFVFLGANVSYVYLLIGGTLVLLGLSVVQSLAIVFTANVMWLLVGLLGVSGTASGTPSVIVTRAQYGVKGNRISFAGLNWLTTVGYEGVNVAISSLACYALLSTLGISVSVVLKVVIAVGLGLISFVVSFYGHATIVRFSGVLCIAFGAVLLTLGIFVAVKAHGAADGFVPLSGSDKWIAVLLGITVVSAGPYSWGTAADYSRYLPKSTSPASIIGWTALGGYLPVVGLEVIGIYAGTLVDMSDPLTSLGQVLPMWFYRVFLIVAVLGLTANNVLNIYSSGLALQAIGVPLKRTKTVLIDAALGGVLCYILLTTTFLSTFSNLLVLSVTYLGPLLVVYAADLLLRRSRYDGLLLNDENSSSRYWYRAGFNPVGMAALVAGTATSLLCLNTTMWVGPVAHALGGADISFAAGPGVSLVIYSLGMRKNIRVHNNFGAV